MKKWLVLHPFLFALYPVFFIYYQNADLLVFSDAWILMGILISLTLILVSLIRLILKDRHKAGLIVSFFLVIFFSYSRIFAAIPYLKIGKFVISRERYFILAIFLLCIGMAFYTIKSKKQMGRVTKFLNVTSAVLVILSLVQITIIKPKTGVKIRDDVEKQSLQPVITDGKKKAGFPNIYYIILDGYARADVLKDIYQYDNSEFLTYLESKGFFIGSRSNANYSQTSLSLASSLNYEYLDDYLEKDGREIRIRFPLKSLIKNNRVFKFLKQHRYTTIAYSTGYSYTELDTADIYIKTKFPLKDFHIALINTTPIPTVEAVLGIYYQYNFHRIRTSSIVDSLLNNMEHETPFFVFAHILSPHPPFVFGQMGEEINPKRVFSLADGSSYMRMAGASRDEYKKRYKDQLIFISGKVKTIIDRILENATQPTVIILQSDHGPGSMLDWPNPDKTDFRERLAILNALYFSGGRLDDLYHEISPVNTFRFIFNRYFGTKFSLFHDESFHSTWSDPFNFLNVTSDISVKNDCPQ